MSPDFREAKLPTVTLERALIETSSSPKKIYRGLSAIDVANFQPDIDEVINYSLIHPSRHEAAKLIYLDPEGRISFSKLIEGGENFVDTPDPDLRRSILLGRRTIARVHSHPLGTDFSLSDLASLLTKPSLPASNTAKLLVTPDRISIAFRGENTPGFSFYEAKRLAERLDLLLERLIQEYRTPEITQEEFVRLVLGIHRSAIESMISQFDIQIFEGYRSERLLQRVRAKA